MLCYAVPSQQQKQDLGNPSVEGEQGTDVKKALDAVLQKLMANLQGMDYNVE